MASLDSHANGPNKNACHGLPSQDVGFVNVIKIKTLVYKRECVIDCEKFENSLGLLAEIWIWVSVDSGTVGVFADKAPAHWFPPSCNIYVDEVDVLAWVGGIAPDDAWREEAAF